MEIMVGPQVVGWTQRDQVVFRVIFGLCMGNHMVHSKAPSVLTTRGVTVRKLACVVIALANPPCLLNPFGIIV